MISGGCGHLAPVPVAAGFMLDRYDKKCGTDSQENGQPIQNRPNG